VSEVDLPLQARSVEGRWIHAECVQLAQVSRVVDRVGACQRCQDKRRDQSGGGESLTNDANPPGSPGDLCVRPLQRFSAAEAPVNPPLTTIPSELPKPRAAGVVANWYGLRVTRSELIEGYGNNARRHPLAGLTARVEDSGTKAHRGGGRDDRRVHVIIEGPNTAVVKTRRVGGTYNADTAARKFAATFNVLSKQASSN
jgi:hypothetical protein